MSPKPTYEELEQQVKELQKEVFKGKQAEAALKESERRHRTLIDTMNEGLVEVDENWHITFINDRFSEMLGFSRDQIIGRRFYELASEGYMLKAQEEHASRKQGKTAKYELELVRADGKKILVFCSPNPSYDSEGKYLGGLGIVTDITELKQAREEIQKARLEWESIFQAIGNPTLILDGDHRLIHANQATEKVTGNPERDLMGKTCYKIFHNASEAPEECPFEVMKDSGNFETVEMEMEALGGIFLVSCTPMLGKDGRIEKVIHIATDITERKRTEEKYRLLADNISDNIWVLDLSTMRFSYVSPSVKGITGYSAEEATGFRLNDTLTPESMELATKTLTEELLKDDQDRDESRSRILELEQYRKDGTTVWTEVSTSFIRDSEGRPSSILGVTRDITERKHAEKKLEESEKNLRQILEATTDGIWTWNFKTEELTFSPKYYTMLGYEPDEFPADYENWIKLIHPEDRDNAVAVAEEYLKNKSDVYKNQFRLRTGDGEYRWIRTRARVIEQDENGQAVYMIGNHEDITEAKLSEEALQESENRYRLLVDTAVEGIWVMDGEHVTTYVNQAMADMIGYTRAEMLGTKVEEFFFEEDLDFHNERMKKRQSGEDEIYERRFRKKDGSTLWTLASAKALKDAQDRFAGSFAMFTDITARKLIEDQLRQAHKMEAIGNLAGGIAHEFNNVLGIILGNAELAMDDVPDWNPAKESLKEIRKASFRAKEVVRQILSFARKTMTALKPLEINMIVKESLKLMRASIPAMVDIQPNIPSEPRMILGDPIEIHQIVINLCTNAAHAMKASGGILEVAISEVTLDVGTASRYEDLSPGDFVKLTVRDTGEGIPPDILEKAFEPYFTTKEFGAGSGMGLAVVYGIVKKCKGAINIHSTVGEGTTVEILFPKIEEEAPAKEEKEEELPAGSERILLVDDDTSIVNMICQMLERIGYTVAGMTDSRLALERFKSNPDDFDLVITDMSMPKMSGDQLAAELIKVRTDIPILLCTGHSDIVGEKKVKEIGIKGFAMKPLDMGKLARAVRSALDDG